MSITPEIIRIYKELGNLSLKYCKICLRTTAETKLVYPKNFLTFTKALNICFKNVHVNICYMCEAQARSALQFYQQITFAVFLDMLYYELDVKSQLVATVIKYFNAHINNQKEMERDNGTLVIANTCESSVRRVRARAQLAQTDVIVVDTNTQYPMQHFSSANHQKKAIPPQQPTISPDIVILDDEDENDDEIQTDKNGDMFIINNPKPQHSSAQKKPLDILNKDIIIERDEKNMPKIVPMSTFLSSNDANVVAFVPDGNSLIDRHRKSKEHYVLHPVIMGVDGRKYVPSLSAKLDDNKLVRLKNCVFQEDDSVEKVAEDVGIDSGPPDQNTSDTEQNILSNSNINNIKDKKRQSIAKTEDSEDVGNKRSRIELQVNNSRSIQCGVINKNIDWEDKIPMDVISFMDATDPNASKNLMKPTESILPDIYQVHTVGVVQTFQPEIAKVESIGGEDEARPAGPVLNYLLDDDLDFVLDDVGNNPLLHRLENAKRKSQRQSEPSTPVVVVPESILPNAPNILHLEISPIKTKRTRKKPAISQAKSRNKAFKKTTTKYVNGRSDVIDLS